MLPGNLRASKTSAPMEPPLLQNPSGHSGDSSGQGVGERPRPWSPQRKSIIESERSRKMVELLLNKGCKVCASVRVLRERYGSRTHMREVALSTCRWISQASRWRAST